MPLPEILNRLQYKIITRMHKCIVGFDDEKGVFFYESDIIVRSYNILVLSNATKSIN